MDYLDFSDLFDGDPASIALFSTFQFDPVHFEGRLLRTPTLGKARRIVIFMDARQWTEMSRGEIHARGLNHRYLVVPVFCPKGVFHPKLNLLIRSKDMQVQCGSNNLTRSGCMSNLELLNAISFRPESDQEDHNRTLIQEAFAFFENACDHTDPEVGLLVKKWMNEAAVVHPWLRPDAPADTDRPFRLVHTYAGSLWDALSAHLSASEPLSFLILSPFYDQDAKLLTRFSDKWPKSKMELVVQQGLTNLPMRSLKGIENLKLSGLGKVSRRCHAKLIAWRTKVGWECLVGSANLTAAALDGKNVEACFWIKKADALLDGLFKDDLEKRSIKLEDFEPGVDLPPEVEGEAASYQLNIQSAILRQSQLKIAYSHRLKSPPRDLYVELRVAHESKPRMIVNLPGGGVKGVMTTPISKNLLADANGTLIATMVATMDCGSEKSAPYWVIQEDSLTYEASDGAGSKAERIESSGEGLAEYLDEIGSHEGARGVIHYLQYLTIQYFDGGDGLRLKRKFRVNPTDPFRGDVAPSWLLSGGSSQKALERAIYDFCDRHEQQRLCKHMKRGNINGMENYLDILTTLVRILYGYFRRGVVRNSELIKRLCRYLDVTMSREDEDASTEQGYLRKVLSNLGKRSDPLQKACQECDFAAEMRAILLIVQKVRYDASRGSVSRIREALPSWASGVAEMLRDCKVPEPSNDTVRKALEGYKMFSEDEVKLLVKELPSAANVK